MNAVITETSATGKSSFREIYSQPDILWAGKSYSKWEMPSKFVGTKFNAWTRT